MSGDYSRRRFDPRAHHAGVLMQQGRVQLDSDWNEVVEIADRRLRAETVDLVGGAPKPGLPGVAVYPRQTPEAFLVKVANGRIAIGRGRMYVDGLLAENHGTGAPELDPVLAETRGSADVPYDAQPDHPAPAALPAGGPHLVYLDAWQREVTHLERPDLVDAAIGVDTTTRWQTVWQVRVLANVGANVGCTTPDDQVPGWRDLIRPSAGRLSTKAIGVKPEDDPCAMPPSGGYRGLENQLYRVEIHDGGGIGAATFKWSRDNASVASRVAEVVSKTKLRLESLGRDDVLRVNELDWVEIVDDRRELSGEAGDPARRRGEVRKVLEIDEDTRTLTLSEPLPDDLVPTNEAQLRARHLRVRRWDQRGKLLDPDGDEVFDLDAPGSHGVLPVPPAGTPVVLEAGIQLTFSVAEAGGKFRAGDHWVFAARTQTASVEELDAAIPAGVHHHFARLALVTFPGAANDCRVPWPPGGKGGCCTAVVAPGEDVQAAIDALPAEGGCVCLKVGVHPIRAPIRIRRSRVVLHGEAPGTIVEGPGTAATAALPATSLAVGAPEGEISDVVVEGIGFRVTSAPAEAAGIVHVERGARVAIRRCAMVLAAEGTPALAGVYANGCADLTVEQCRVEKAMLGVHSDASRAGVAVCKNVLRGPQARVQALPGNVVLGSAGYAGVWIRTEGAVPCRVEDNRIDDYFTAVWIGAGARGARVERNEIRRQLLPRQGDLPSGDAALRTYAAASRFAIEAGGAEAVVRDNRVDLASSSDGGIRARGRGALIRGNTLAADLPREDPRWPVGICCSATDTGAAAAHAACVAENVLTGPQVAILVARCTGAEVSGNRIDGAGLGLCGVALDEAADARVAENDVRGTLVGILALEAPRVRVAGNRVEGGLMGLVLAATDPEVTGNHLVGAQLMGALVGFLRTAAVSGNRISRCGFADAGGAGLALGAGDFLTATDSNALVTDNEIVDTGLSPDGKTATRGRAVGLAGLLASCEITGNRIGYSADPEALDAAKEHRALELMGPLDRISQGLEASFGAALVAGNQLRSRGGSHVAALVGDFQAVPNDPTGSTVATRFERVTFSDNVCEHVAPIELKDRASVRLWGRYLTAMGNQVRGNRIFSVDLTNQKYVALVGNVTDGGYLHPGGARPTPIDGFNVKV
jgi:hypothetical protein